MINKTNLKLADAEVPFSDYGQIKTVEVINPERSDDTYIWNLSVLMRLESGSHDHSYKVQYLVDAETRAAIINAFQHPELASAKPSRAQLAQLQRSFRDLKSLPGLSWWKRLLARLIA